MLAGEGLTPTQLVYMDNPHVSANDAGGTRWSQMEADFVGTDTGRGVRGRSYTIGSSLDPAIDAIKAAVKQAGFALPPVVFARDGAYARDGDAMAGRPMYCSVAPPERRAERFREEDVHLLSLVAEYRSVLREFVCGFSSTGEEATAAETRAALNVKVAQSCAAWLESLSRDASASPLRSDGQLTQIEVLAASVPPSLAGEAIVSLLKTAILQSLLLTRMAARETASFPQPQHFSFAASPASPSPAQHAHSALLSALRESPSDSTITSLLQEVDLQRIAAKFSVQSGNCNFPPDVGSLLRSTAPLEPETLISCASPPARLCTRNRSYSDFHELTAARSNGVDSNGIPKGKGRRSEGDPTAETAADNGAVSVSAKKKKAQPRSASPANLSSVSVVNGDSVSGPVLSAEGMHVPQLDLDAILMPYVGDARPGERDAARFSGGGEDGSPSASSSSDWQQRIRQEVRRGTLSLLKANKNSVRLRSYSDLAAGASKSVIAEDIDLRPTWMRKPRLLKSVNAKMQSIQTPIFYVEWNILGFIKILNDPSQDRIVSPEYAVFIPPDVTLPPLRLMVSIHKPHQEKESPVECQYKDVKIGVEFTIPADIDVKYHVFHGSFLSDARWHCFKDKPWAGVNASDAADPVPHPIDQSLTVGVILLEIKGKGLTQKQAKSQSSSSITSDHKPPSTGGAGAEGLSAHDSQSNISGSPRRLAANSSSSASRQVSWLNHGASFTGTMVSQSGISLNGLAGPSPSQTRPRAYSDWQSTGSQPSRRLPAAASQQRFSPQLPPGLPSVSDLLRLSGVVAPETLLSPSVSPNNIQPQGSPVSQQTNVTGSLKTQAETPSLMLHESLSKMTLRPAPFDKQLFSHIWNSSSASPHGETFDDLVSGCLR